MQTTERVREVLKNGVSRGSTTLPLPSVAAIGYIPLNGDAPAPVWSSVPHADIIFRSGNYRPTADILNADDLVRYLSGRRDYRGAIMIDELQITVDDSGSPAVVEFSTLTDFLGCGYTPQQSLMYRPAHYTAPRPGSQQWTRRVFCREKGITRGDPKRYEINLTGSELEIVHWQTFRLGHFANLGAKVLTQAAPFAWLQISYTISLGGAFEAHVAGSAIPSVTMFGGTGSWSEKATRCMVTDTRTQIDDFLFAGADLAAPDEWILRVV